jgi:hypothetical protein
VFQLRGGPRARRFGPPAGLRGCFVVGYLTTWEIAAEVLAWSSELPP